MEKIKVCHDLGVDAVFGTFEILAFTLSRVDVGKAVTLVLSNCVGLGKSGDVLLGVIEDVQGEKCIVQMSGVARFQCSPDSSSPIFCRGVVVDGKGRVFYASPEYGGTGKVLAISGGGETCDVKL